MKIYIHDDDERLISDSGYLQNMGSFGQIIHGISAELKKRGMLGTPENADWVGFTTSTKLDFGFRNKKRFVIQAWEFEAMPHFIQQAKYLDLKLISLSPKSQAEYKKLGYETKVVDIGTNPNFFKPLKGIQKSPVFQVLSVTSANFRSGLNHTLLAFEQFAKDKKDKVKLVIKNTDERAVRLPYFCREYRENGYNVDYICERLNIDKIRELYAESHILCYNPIVTDGGIPQIEAAAMELPCITTDFIPSNIYPHSEVVKTSQKSILEVRDYLCNKFMLPYTVPENWLNESVSMVNWLDETDFAVKLQKIYDNYQFYLEKAKENRKIVRKRWSWSNSTDQLLEILK